MITVAEPFAGPDSWAAVSSLRAASERCAAAGNYTLAEDYRQQANAMARRLEAGRGVVGRVEGSERR